MKIPVERIGLFAITNTVYPIHKFVMRSMIVATIATNRIAHPGEEGVCYTKTLLNVPSLCIRVSR